MENKRDSNFELLRCVAMFIIVLCHMRAHGFKIVSYNDEPTLNILILKSFNWLGTIGNFLFMLISGYFITAKSSEPKKIFKLWLQIFFYSVIFGTISFVLKLDVSSLASGYVFRKMTLFDYLRCFFPFLSCHNWYASAYLIFLLFVPFLNVMLDKLDQLTHRRLCYVLIFVGGGLTNLRGFTAGFVPSCIYAFIMMYFIAKYIRLYNPKILSNVKRNLIIAFLMCVSFCLYSIIICLISKKIPFIQNHKSVFLELYAGKMTCFFPIICAVLIFSGFKELYIPYNKIINFVASSTFGIYLIHEDLSTKYYMWVHIFKTDDWINSKFLFLYMPVVALIIFIFGIAIEQFRKYCFEKPVYKLIENRKKENSKESVGQGVTQE